MDGANENARPGAVPGRAQGQENPSQNHADEASFGSDDAGALRVRTPSFGPLIRAGLQLIPLHRWDAVDSKGRPRGKSPRDGAWQLKDYDSREVAAAAERNNTNAGVRLPASVVVLDVDPRNFGEGDSLLALMIDTGLDLTGVPRTATGSGGSHYWFSKPVDVQLVDSLEAYPGVEFKSLGRQVVAAGSIHPNGRHYEWDGEVDLRDLPELPPCVLDLARRPRRSHGEAAGLGELTPEMLAETLDQLDPCDFRDHEAWLLLMMACHYATAGEGRQEFVDWSTEDPQYADHGWIVGRRWDSLHAGGTTRGGRPITVRYLHKVVQEHGGQVAQPRPEDDFEAVEADVPDGFGVDDDKLRAEPELVGVDAVIEVMNARHYVVLDNGFQVVTEEHDPLFEGRVRYQRLSKSDFRSAYENRTVEVNNKLISHADVWLKSAWRRQYKGMIFDPAARDHDGWLNMWKGWSVQPKPGDWSLLGELILDVLVDGNREHFEWVLDWMAFMFQNPEKVAEVAVAFRGKKGTGKGTLGRALVKLAGAQGLHIASPSHLTGRFNSHLQNCVCLFADEAFWAGDKAGESVLKQLVTEPTLTYEGKGRDAVTGRNHVHIVMASNNDWVVPAGLDGERRFAVFDVSDRRIGDHAFFSALNRQLDNGGLAALLHDMLARDLSGRHPRERVPQTRALAAQKAMSMSPEEAWWDELLTLGEVPRPFAEPDDWANGALAVDLQALHTLYVDFVTRHKMGRVRTPKALAMAIKKKAGVERRQVGKDKKWFWILPQLEEARVIWAKVMGHID